MHLIFSYMCSGLLFYDIWWSYPSDFNKIICIIIFGKKFKYANSLVICCFLYICLFNGTSQILTWHNFSKYELKKKKKTWGMDVGGVVGGWVGGGVMIEICKDATIDSDAGCAMKYLF
jgi:hypothetical protein